MRVAHRHADRPPRDPVEEVDGAVERVDDPAQPARALVVGALLLGEERVVGAALRDQRADRALRREVGLADRIGRRRLARDARSRPASKRSRSSAPAARAASCASSRELAAALTAEAAGGRDGRDAARAWSAAGPSSRQPSRSSRSPETSITHSGQNDPRAARRPDRDAADVEDHDGPGVLVDAPAGELARRRRRRQRARVGQVGAQRGQLANRRRAVGRVQALAELGLGQASRREVLAQVAPRAHRDQRRPLVGPAGRPSRAHSSRWSAPARMAPAWDCSPRSRPTSPRSAARATTASSRSARSSPASETRPRSSRCPSRSTC